MSEITDDYINDPDVHRWPTTAKAAKISGSGTQSGIAWLITVLPDKMIDSDNPSAEASGGPTIRVSLDEDGVNQINLDVQDFSPASGGIGGGATARLWINPGDHEAGEDLPVTLWWITGGSQTQPAPGDTYGAYGVYSDYGGFWEFDEDPSGSAPQMLDKTANGNDGTSQGGMTSGDQIDFIEGTGLDFDGSNDAINVPDDDSLSFDSTTGLTVGFFFRSTSQTGFRTFLSKRNNDEAVDAEYFIGKSEGSNILQIGFYDGGFHTITSSWSGSWGNGTTFFFCGTWNQNGSDVDLEIYQDGSLIDSGTVNSQTVNNNAAPVTIGATKYTTASFDEEVDADIGFPFIYHGVLTADQIATLFENLSDNSDFWDTTAAVEDGPFPSAGSGSGSGVAIDTSTKKTITRALYERLVVWAPRSFQICEVSGRQGLIGPAPVISPNIYAGSQGIKIDSTASFDFRVIKEELVNQLRVMAREGCKVRMIALGHDRHHAWLTDSNLIIKDTRAQAIGFAGLATRVSHRLLDTSERQFTNLLECFPWSCTEAAQDVGSGSGSGSGAGGDYYLEPIGEHAYSGERWLVIEGESVDSIGAYAGSGAALSFTLPVEGARLKLERQWVGSISFYDYAGTLLETHSKSTNEAEVEVDVPGLTWSVTVVVSSSSEAPCITIPYAGEALGSRPGSCLDCTDPDAVALGVPDWVEEGSREPYTILWASATDFVITVVRDEPDFPWTHTELINETDSGYLGIRVDQAAGYIFADVLTSTLWLIRRYDLDGNLVDTPISIVLPAGVQNFDIDRINKRIVYGRISGGGLSTANVISTDYDGSNPQTHFTSAGVVQEIGGIALDPFAQYCYYRFNQITGGATDAIRRLDLSDDSSVDLSELLGNSTGGQSSVDAVHGRYIFPDGNSNDIKYIPIPDGGSIFTQANQPSITGAPWGDPVDEKLYIAHLNDRIYRRDYDDPSGATEDQITFDLNATITGIDPGLQYE